MKPDKLHQQFKAHGFIHLKGLFSTEEVTFYIHKLEAQAGLTRQDLQGNQRGHGFGGPQPTAWNLPDGVSKSPDFWPLITHQRLLNTVKTILGPDVRFLQHTDLHVGFSAIAWHRDNVNRTFGYGPDWDESHQPYRLVRVAIYLQSYAESGFRLGFIEESHRPTPTVSLGRKVTEAKLKWLGGLSYLSPQVQMWAANARWIATEPGDCLIFDPRLIHSGSYISGPKFSIFLAYGVENRHFYHHQNYYRRIRSELNYQDLDARLVDRLKVADLYPHQTPVYKEIEGAWQPPGLLKKQLARRFKE